MLLKEKTLSKEYVFNGRIINVRRDSIELPDGKPGTREVVEHKGGVCVLALTKDNEILMVRQFRYPYLEEVLEIPAGKRESLEEDPFECGKRELKEETGATAQSYTFLGKLYPTPGYTNEIIYMYLAEDLSFGEDNPDEDEFLEVEKIHFKTALKMVLDGQLPDAKTQCAILKTALLRGFTI